MNKKAWQEAGRYLFFMFFLSVLAAMVFLSRNVVLQKGAL